MEELDLNRENVEIDLVPTTGSRAISTIANKELLVALHSQRTDKPIEEVRAQADTIGVEPLELQARLDAANSVDDSFQITANQAIEVSSLPDILAADDSRVAATEVAENTEVPDTFAVLAAGNRYEFNQARSASRIIGLAKVAEEELAREEITVGSVVVDLVDMLVSIPIDAVRLGGFERTDAAVEIRDLLSADIPDKEFYARARTVLREAADAGILTDSNFFFLSGQIANVQEGGQGETGGAEELFNVLDLTGVGIASTKIIRMLRNTAAFTSLMMGPSKAGRVLANGVAQPNSLAAESAGVAREVPVSMLRPVERSGNHLDMIAPGAAISESVEQSNTFFQIIKNAPFFRDVDPAKLAEFLPIGERRLAETISKQQRRRVQNIAVQEDDLSNLFGTITFGKSDGLPFQKLDAAEKFAASISSEAKVVSLPTLGEPNYVVNLTKNLSSHGLIDPLDATEIGQTFMRAFGGNFITLPKRLDALAKFGESALTGTVAKIRPLLESKLKAVSKAENEAVERVFYELRDGDRLAQRRSALSLVEFRTEYARHSKGNIQPTKAAEELYSTIQELNDALYLFKADITFKQAVKEGSELFQFSLLRRDGETDNWSLIVNDVARETLKGDPTVLDVISGVGTPASQLPKNRRIFAVSGGYEVGGKVAKFVTSENPNLRRVYHSDVLGYNPGGPRAYDQEYSHIVKQAATRTDIDGKEFAGAERSIILAKSEKEGLQASTEINNIFKAFREAVPNLTQLTKARAIRAIKNLRTSPELEQIVRKNNSWNPEVEDIDALESFLVKSGVDPRKNVGLAAKDEALATLDDASRPIFGGASGQTHDDAVTSLLNQPRNGPRRDSPLFAFGKDAEGNRKIADTVSPLDLIQNDLMRVTHSKAFQAFNFRSVNGWLEGAQDFITPAGKEKIAGMSPLQALRAGDDIFGKTSEGRSFLAARSAILRVLNNKSNAELKWNSMVDNFGQFVYDKDWKRLSSVMRNSKVAKTPLEFLRGMTFDARLGLMDPGQLIVQASQTFNILGIIGPSRGGDWLQSMASHLPLRLAARTDDHGLNRMIEPPLPLDLQNNQP